MQGITSTLSFLKPGRNGGSFKLFVATMACAGLCATAQAQETEFDLPLASSPYVRDYEAFKLAAAEDAQAATPMNAVAPPLDRKDAEPGRLTASDMHKYLGLATIVGAALTAMTAPEGCENNCTAQTTRDTNGTHAKLAQATVAMALATVVTGMLVHHDDIHLADGIRDPDNLHALLGVAGAALMAYAVNKSKNSAVPVSHAGIAETGALCMVAAIKITW